MNMTTKSVNIKVCLHGQTNKERWGQYWGLAATELTSLVTYHKCLLCENKRKKTENEYLHISTVVYNQKNYTMMQYP